MCNLHTYMNDAKTVKFIIIVTSMYFKESNLQHSHMQKLAEKNYLQWRETCLCQDVVPEDVDLECVAESKHRTEGPWEHHTNGKEQPKVHPLRHHSTMNKN